MSGTQNPWGLKTRNTINLKESAFITAAFKGANRVLDAGGGTGFYIHEALKERQVSIVVFDQDQQLLDYGKQQFPNSTFVQGSYYEMPFQDDSFDGVLIRANLLYFSDKSAYLKEVARVLRPGGALVIVDRNKLDLTTVLARIIGAKQDPFEQPKDFMSFGQLRSYLMKSGFDVEDELGLMLSIPKPQALRSLFTSDRVSSRVIRRFAAGGVLKYLSRWMLVYASAKKYDSA